jgi:hypothetical protein
MLVGHLLLVRTQFSRCRGKNATIFSMNGKPSAPTPRAVFDDARQTETTSSLYHDTGRSEGPVCRPMCVCVCPVWSVCLAQGPSCADSCVRLRVTCPGLGLL